MDGETGSGDVFNRGWTRVTINRPLKPQDVAFIAPGKTKWNDVIKRLGAPNQLIMTSSGIVANYYYYDGRHFGTDFGWPLGFLGPVSLAPHSMILRKAGVGVDTFEVGFDSAGTVEYDSFSHTAPPSS